MTLCPVAIAVTCRKCPIVAACPVKSVIGDFVAPKPGTADKAAAEKSKKK